MIAWADAAPPPGDEDAPPWCDDGDPRALERAHTARKLREAMAEAEAKAKREQGPPATTAAKAESTNADVWEDPEPLHRPLTEPDPYPVHAFGALAGVVGAIARGAQAPLELAGQSVLGAASLAVQGLADAELPTGEAVPCSLFLLSIVESGGRKSTCDRSALRGVYEFESEDARRYREELREHRIAKEAWNATRKRMTESGKRGAGDGPPSGQLAAMRRQLELLGPEPVEPMRDGLVTSAPTAEGLQRRLMEGRPSLGLFSAEGGSFMQGHAMSDEARRRSAAVLCAQWDGAPHVRDRVGESVRIAGKRLSLHLLATPGVAGDFLARGDLSDIGLFSRMLVAAPASLAGTRQFRDPDPADLETVERFKFLLLELLRRPLPLNANESTAVRELAPPALTMDAEARALWRAFHDELEAEMGPAGKLHTVRDRVNKAPENAGRVAAVLALAGDPAARVVGGEAMAGAVELVAWSVGEMLRLSEAGMLAPRIREAEELRRWLAANWATRPESVTPEDLRAEAPPGAVAVVALRDIYRCGPSSLRTRDQAKAAVSVLEAHGWLVAVAPPTTTGRGGRPPGTRYFIRRPSEEKADGMA